MGQRFGGAVQRVEVVLVREEEITHGLKGQGARQCAAAAFVAQYLGMVYLLFMA